MGKVPLRVKLSWQPKTELLWVDYSLPCPPQEATNMVTWKLSRILRMCRPR